VRPRLQLTTLVKAFYGAPVWTQSEVNLFAAAFEAIDCKIMKKKRRDLCSFGPPGKPCDETPPGT
jgi:hypothetical protein